EWFGTSVIVRLLSRSGMAIVSFKGGSGAAGFALFLSTAVSSAAMLLPILPDPVSRARNAVKASRNGIGRTAGCVFIAGSRFRLDGTQSSRFGIRAEHGCAGYLPKT